MLLNKVTSKFHPFTNYDFSNFYFGSGNDVYDTIRTFNQWWDEVFAGATTYIGSRTRQRPTRAFP